MLVVHKETVELDYEHGSEMKFEDRYFTGISMEWSYRGNNITISAKNKQTVADLFFGDKKEYTWEVLLNGNPVEVGADVTEFVREIILSTQQLYQYYMVVKTAVHEFGCMELYIKTSKFGPTRPFYGYFDTWIIVNPNSDALKLITLRIIEHYLPAPHENTHNELDNEIELFSHRYPFVNVFTSYLNFNG